MRIVLLSPGTGDFHCGSCIRDATLARGLRELGHDALVVPLYLPFRAEGEDGDAPIFLGGINMYLQQVSRLFRRTPRWLDRLLDAPGLLRLAARRAAMTRPEDLGALTVSTLLGEAGRQAKEVERLAGWLAGGPPPDVLCLGNALLVGLARRLRAALPGTAVLATLQGEDGFLDSLPSPHRERAWSIVAERTRELDGVIPVSRTHGALMRTRLDLDPGRVHPVPNGIRTDDVAPAEAAPDPPVVGYLARTCAEKGLPTLVEAFLRLAREDRVPGLRLRIAGTRTRADLPLVRRLRDRVRDAGLADRVSWHPDVSRSEKLALLRGFSVLSVPATYGEAFGLYVLEALAAGVPVVQPRHGAFPELLEATGGGVLCAPDDPADLARALGELLRDPDRARALGARGRAAVLREFTPRRMAEGVLEVFARARAGYHRAPPP